MRLQDQPENFNKDQIIESRSSVVQRTLLNFWLEGILIYLNLFMKLHMCFETPFSSSSHSQRQKPYVCLRPVCLGLKNLKFCFDFQSSIIFRFEDILGMSLTLCHKQYCFIQFFFLWDKLHFQRLRQILCTFVHKKVVLGKTDYINM